MENVIIGIDLGGTNLRIGAVTPDNQIISPLVVKSKVVAYAEQPLQKLCEIIDDYREERGIQAIDAISIGVPSSVENDKETVICTTNIRNAAGEVVFEHTNMAKDIREYFQVPVYINNDVNNILIYDIAANHLEEQKVVVGIYVGTGVGAAVSINGELLEGKNGAELDIGDIPYYNRDGKSAQSEKQNCCEYYASGWKLQKIRDELYPDTAIQDLFTLHGSEQPLCEFIHACAHIYAVMATIFNPDSIIVGGGVPEMKDFPRTQFEQDVNQSTGKDVMAYGFDYVYSKDYIGKGLIGAAIFARKRQAQVKKG